MSIFYLKSGFATGSLAGPLADGVVQPTGSTGTTLITSNAEFGGVSGLMVWATSSTGGALVDPITQDPVGPIALSASDCWRSENVYSGQFAAGTWTVGFGAKSNASVATAASIGWNFRIWRASSPMGAGAVELTSAVISTPFSPVSVNGAQVSATASLGIVNVTNEYIFIEVAWAYNAPPTVTKETATIWTGPVVGSGSYVSTPTFTPSSGSGGAVIRLLSLMGVGT